MLNNFIPGNYQIKERKNAKLIKRDNGCASAFTGEGRKDDVLLF